ncbi:MAG: tRNA pseudouridine(55) synthase TruB [Bacteroidales bacterium]|nr:tRNA pseudouridine(55) synthase TruB [Bacteroidales bacterium]
MLNFYTGEILLFDKPREWSSFDVVNKTRILIKIKFGKKLKVGHAGTLDPLATGLLILCTGKKTKEISEFSGLDKEYIATIAFGNTTPSYDLETEPDKFYKTEQITEDKLIEALKTFEGKQMQTPPIFSAKKINGEKAYINARLGKEVEVRQQEIDIKEIEVLDANLPHEVKIRMVVSKGTYIRSFAHDLGQKLNSGAYLKNLIRTKIGNFDLKNAYSLEDFEKVVQETEIEL